MIPPTPSERPHASAILARLREQLARDVRRGAIIPGPDPPSGWLHNFTCSRCAQKLPFNPDDAPPFVCPQCDRGHDDADKRQAWVAGLNLYQIRAARHSVRFEDDADLLGYARDVLVGYARAYPDYEVHGRWAGKGRLQGQSLSEAVWMLPAVETHVELARRRVTSRDEQAIVQSMFREAIDLLVGQMGQVHNIHVWIASAVSAMAVVTDRVDALRQAEEVLDRNVAEGILPDGSWFEGSPHYQFYTVQAFLSYLTAMTALGRKPRHLEAISRLCRQPVRLLTVGGEIAHINDGWPTNPLAARAPLYEMAQGLVGGFEDVLGTCYHELGATRDSVQAALYGPADLPDARLEPASFDVVDGVAVARRGGLVVLVKANPDGGGHDHPDKPMLAIHRISPHVDAGDLGNPGYGNPLHAGWFRTTAAHNTVIIDGGDHRPGSGEIVRAEETDAFSLIEARRSGAAAGGTITRSVVVGDGWVFDRTTAEADGEHEFCWRFHAVAELQDLPPGEPCPFVPNEYVCQQRKLHAGQVLKGHWESGNGGRLHLCCWRPPGGDFYAARAPALPATRSVDLLAVVERTRHLVVDAVFSLQPVEVYREQGDAELSYSMDGVRIRIGPEGRLRI